MGVWSRPIWKGESTVTIPDSIKIATLLNETKGALQQHLQLTASNTRDYNTVRGIIIEYYRTTASFSRMQQLQSFDPNTTNYQATLQGPAPMDLGAAYNSSRHNSKGKGKEGPSERKRKVSRKRIQQLLQQQRKRKRRISHRPRESTSTRKSILRSIKRERRERTEHQHERKKKIKRKRHMLQMWATRPHGKELSGCSVQRRQQWASTVGEWSNVWLVSRPRPMATRVWSRMVQPGLVTTRIWPRTSTTSIIAVTTTGINYITRNGPVHQCHEWYPQATSLSINRIGQPPGTDESIMIDSGAATHVRSTMVWNIAPSDETTRQTRLEDSYRNKHLGFWVSVDSLPQPTRTTHRDPILCLWCEATHLVSHQADTSRILRSTWVSNQPWQIPSPLKAPSHKRMDFSTSTWSYHHYHQDNRW